MEGRGAATIVAINSKALIVAAGLGEHSAVEYYIKEGADVNFRDGDGNTALHWAVNSGELTMIERLLHNGAKNMKNSRNETPISLAKRLKNSEALDILMSTLHPNTNVHRRRLQGTIVNHHANPIAANINNNNVLKLGNTFCETYSLEKRAAVPTHKQYQHETGGSAVHGNIYQLKILMLFLIRGVSRQYSFRLGTEVKAANKFDDLVFEYTESNRKVYRLLQAKHKLDESKKITAKALLGYNDGDYSLVKYFRSYSNCKQQAPFKHGAIKDVTICTNIDFDFNNLESARIKVEKLRNIDTILDVENALKQPARYRFTAEIVSVLARKLGSVAHPLHEIYDFLNHLVFAVNQPNEDELGTIIKQEIGREFDSVTTENVYNKLLVQMLDWLQGKQGDRFLSYKEGQQFFEEAKRGMPILFNVKAPENSFTGRTRELHELHEMLQGGRESPQIGCICGPSGVGKSELARKYISVYRESYDNKILWINAESYKSLAASFRRLASDKLNICTENANGCEKEMRSIVEDVYNFFIKQKSLFVFDNVGKYKSRKGFGGLIEFLPSLPPEDNALHVLITSRKTNWPEHFKVLELYGCNESEATDFLKRTKRTDFLKKICCYNRLGLEIIQRCMQAQV